jgi:streptogramin lyase
MIGRLVPKTGDIKLVHLPTANALPYGIAVNADGISFFAEFGANKLASIDAKAMEIPNIPYLTEAADRGALRSRAMARAAILADLIHKRVPFANGLRPVVRTPVLTGSLPSEASSGTANPA